MKRRLWWLLPCLWAVSGCAALDVYLDIVRDKGLTPEYRAVLERWTRSQTVYSLFETRVRITATYRNEEFSRAYLQEHARLYRLTEEEQQKREALQTAALAESSEFIVYAYVPGRETNDFDRQQSIWSIFLVNDLGERVAPLEVRRVEPVTQVVRDFFPYINPYYGFAYHLRFPPNQPAGKVTLVFTGVIATVELDFITP